LFLFRLCSIIVLFRNMSDFGIILLSTTSHGLPKVLSRKHILDLYELNNNSIGTIIHLNL
jgi:hypothetical protein